jgi:ubiquinone/menaquinone biosynthesis C-methylase UbiE
MRFLPAFLAFGLALDAQVADKANERYKTSEGRAGMLNNLGAADRADRLQAAKLVQALGIKPGQSAADLGTGGGALLPLLSSSVGSRGVVYAEDIFDDFLAAAKKKAETAGLANVRFVRGTERSVNLPAASVDIALTVDAYHHFDYPGDLLATIRSALKPGGRFAIVDYYKRPGAMGGTNAVEHIRLDKDDVIKEVTGFGWKLVEQREHVPNSQYIAIFTPAQ